MSRAGITRWITGTTNSSLWGYRIYIEETVDDDNNSSTIKLCSQFGRTASSASYMNNAYIDEDIYINGIKQTTRRVYLNRGTSSHQTFYANTWDYTRTNNNTSNYLPSGPVAYWTHTINHDQDGTKTITIRVSTTTDVTPSSASVSSTTIELTPIPRNPLIYFKAYDEGETPEDATWRTANVFVKVNNTWKKAKSIFVKVGGTWRKVTRMGNTVT